MIDFCSIFPYESIRKDSKIVIYGMGSAGMNYFMQVLTTNYCEIIYAVDKNYNNYLNFPHFPVYSPEKLKEDNDYDYVLVAVKKESFLRQIEENLLKLGVPKEKIIIPQKMGCTEELYYHTLMKRLPNPPEDKLCIGIVCGGGIGDSLMETVFIKEVRKLVGKSAVIDYFSNNCFDKPDFIDKIYRVSDNFNKKYDVNIVMRRIPLVVYINEEKVKRFNQTFYEYCMDCKKIRSGNWSLGRIDNLIVQYALIKGKNRIEQYNINNIIELDRNTPTYLKWDISDNKILAQYGLEDTKYITICRSAGDDMKAKLWPLEYYNELLGMIKDKYPEIKLVKIGDSKEFGDIYPIDIDLEGKTTLEEVIPILKYSALLISPEGGMVHMKHFLNGKSVVLFGPTSPEVFGYANNINLRTTSCCNYCEWVTDSSLVTCIKSGGAPECLKELEPEYVFSKVKEVLDNIPEYTYDIVFQKNVGRLEDAKEEVKKFIERKGLEKVCYVNGKSYVDIGKESYLFDDDVSSIQYKNLNVKAEYGNVCNIPSKDNSYDVIVDLDFCEAVGKYALKEYFRITDDGKYVILYFVNQFYIPQIKNCMDTNFIILRKANL